MLELAEIRSGDVLGKNKGSFVDSYCELMVLRLPVKLDTTSNGEFEPIPLEFVHERANRLAHEFATDTVLSHRAETFFRRRWP